MFQDKILSLEILTLQKDENQKNSFNSNISSFDKASSSTDQSTGKSAINSTKSTLNTNLNK